MSIAAISTLSDAAAVAQDFPASPACGCVGSTACHSHACRDAVERLRASEYPPVRSVRCEFREGVLTLAGRLPSFYLKQIAQTLVAPVDGVRMIVNRIEVQGSGA